MLDSVLHAFSVVPDYDLSIMKQQQTLFDVTVGILERIRDVLDKEKPDVVLAVSYTHLDVYKRQVQRSAKSKKKCKLKSCRL